MQVNPPQKTIEGDLFKAFVDAGAISKDNADDPKKSSFIRAARTDKGVHAGGNVVSLKLIIEDPDIVDKINAHLPEQIRVWGYFRTNKSFECRKNCSSRIYEYLIPSFSFLPPKPSSVLATMIEEAKKEVPGETRDDAEGTQFWKNVEEQLRIAGISESDQTVGDADAEGVDLSPAQRTAKKIENEARRSYRISEERLNTVREALKMYEGVHNFHNFTIGKSFKDPSCSRYMKSLTVSDPKVINNTEWLSIKIHGQSFMLHQIRKMIGLVALVVRTGCSLTRISQAFASTRINIPKAPALGLLLEQPVYAAYNRRLGECGYDPISFDKWASQIEEFKMKHIYDKIYTEEVKENVFHGFFSFIDYYRIDNVFEYLTARGIPANGTAPVPKFEQPNDAEEVGSDTEG
jgi:tRNA pseudouridine38-40 synthase